MQPAAEFVAEVDANINQALDEGWISVRSTATTLGVGIGVLLTRIDTVCDADTVRAVRRAILMAVGAL